jgi:hypothetical protein
VLQELKERQDLKELKVLQEQFKELKELKVQQDLKELKVHKE